MRLRVFASGSKGNCLAVSSGASSILVDLGLSCRETLARMKACAFDPSRLAGVLFTHDHEDHCSGAATFRKRFPSVPFYANGATADAVEARSGVSGGWKLFETASSFDAGGFSVTAFSVPHDAADTVGYLISDGEKNLFVATDFGCVTSSVRDAFSRADAAVLESNHDMALLSGSNRPWSLKQRIAGRSGHLSNDGAADLVRSAASPRLKILLLAHLSEECNASRLALETAKEACSAAGLADIPVEALSQNEPSRLYVF